MAKRKITYAARVGRSTHLRLECGHERSIGGHTFPDYRYIERPYLLVDCTYDCQEGHCYGK